MSTDDQEVEHVAAQPAQSHALAAVPTVAIVGPQSVEDLRLAIAVERDRRKLLEQYISESMVEGVDFGKVPGTRTPTLYKAGAEKLIDLFRVRPTYGVVTRVELWDKPLFHYEVRCGIMRGEEEVAIGFGSCNSMEAKYRYRNAQRICPQCGGETIQKSKREPGYYCWRKKGGCGAQFEGGDPKIEDQKLGKVLNDDVYTQVNTFLKMAKKRAGVDAVIALARCSDMFTQDIDDTDEVDPQGGRDDDYASKPQQQRGKPTPRNEAEMAGPRFSRKVAWKHRAEWDGRPLMAAGLAMLQVYEDAVKEAIKNPRAIAAGAVPELERELKEVGLAIAMQEASVGNENPSWGMENAR